MLRKVTENICINVREMEPHKDSANECFFTMTELRTRFDILVIGDAVMTVGHKPLQITSTHTPLVSLLNMCKPWSQWCAMSTPPGHWMTAYEPEQQ